MICMNNIKYLSAAADRRLRLYLESLGYTVESVLSNGLVPVPLAGHPDLFMCRLGVHDHSEIVYASDDSFPIIGAEYPRDIPYNAACTGHYFIHNLRYTAPRLLVRAEELGMELIDVRQGYAKCSTVTVDEESVITYDDGIAAACEAHGMNVLHIKPGFVELPGYDTGFIGGASGHIDLKAENAGISREAIIFNGDLDGHPDADIIRDFIYDCGLDVIDFPDWKLTDIGSVI